MKKYGNLINGQEVESQATFEAYSSCDTSKLMGIFPESSKEEVKKACLAAKEAFKKWKKTPAPVRGEIIGNIGKAITREKENLSLLLSREMGKTLKEARGDVQEAIDTCAFFQSEGRRLYGQTVPSEMPNKELKTYRRPLGVVGIITAGNFPVAVPSWKIIPALITGNTIVWKPSEDSPLTSYAFFKLLEEAGLPKGVLNVVFGGGADKAGQFLVEMLDEKLVNKIAFTGSTAVGRWIGEVAGRNLTHPTLELGGKSPLVVMRDADLDNAVHGALWASYGTAGQRCTSAGNIIVDAPVYTEFKDKFLQAIQKIKIGNPTDDVLYGPLISKKFFDKWLEHYDWAKEDGATLLYGNGRITEQSKPSGFVGNADEAFYAWPTLWENVTTDMKIFKQEVFGPTVNLVKVDGIDEAIQVANAVDYGLSSAIYTNNRLWANRFQEEIEAGMTSINNSTSGAEAHMPFGGTKGSGNGTRESGIWVLESYTYWQGVNDDISGKLQLAQMETEYIEPQEDFDVSKLI